MTQDAPSDALSGAPPDSSVAYSFSLRADQAQAAEQALHLLIADQSHEPTIRAIARQTLTKVQEQLPGQELQVLQLTEPQLKIFHTAVKILLDDLQRDQAHQRQVLMQILDKLPDQHAIRAITIP